MRRLLGCVLHDMIAQKIGFTEIREIRLRKNRPISVRTASDTILLPILANKQVINNIVSVATNNSLYAYEEEISSGYLLYEGGVRIGLIGDGRVNDKNRLAYQEILSLCIRIPHEIKGCAKSLDFLYDDMKNTLIVSPPGAGKTTLVRELTRIVSERYNTLVIDERYELCGYKQSLSMGNFCDIMQGIPKSLCYENIIRTMSPDVIVCDELFSGGDIDSVMKLIGSGVICLATCHADSTKKVDKRLLNCFDVYVTLASKPRPGSIVSIERRENA